MSKHREEQHRKTLPQKVVESPATRAPDRWGLLRDVAVFQGKLLIDGLRDLLLSPVSIAAALIDLLNAGGRRRNHFYTLLHYGRRSDRIINLFGAADHTAAPFDSQEDEARIDALVGRLEDVVREQYSKGGMTAAAKDRIDALLDRLEDAAEKGWTKAEDVRRRRTNRQTPHGD